MLHQASLLALAAFLATSTALPAAEPDRVLDARQALPSGSNAAPFLNTAATAKGKAYFGTAVAIPGSETSDNEYMTILNDTSIFGQLTPGNAMKVSWRRGVGMMLCVWALLIMFSCR